MPRSKVRVFKKKKRKKTVSETDKGSASKANKASTTTSLIATTASGNVPRTQVDLAVKALVNFVQREQAARKKMSLFQEAENISLIVTLFRTPERGSNKGVVIRIPHTLHPADETRVCIFVKDDAVKPVKERLEGKLQTAVDKVMSLTKLRTRYADHKKRRELCNGFDLFLADDRILPMLTKPLGREFFKHKKQPRPIHVLRKNLEGQIARARDSTRLYLGWGNCSAVRIARTDMTADQIVDNIVEGIAGVAQSVPKGWKGIQALHIKTPDSVALPIYAQAPDAPEPHALLEDVGTPTGGDKAIQKKKRRN